MQREDRSNAPKDGENGDSTAIVVAKDRRNVPKDGENGDSTSIVIATNNEQQSGHQVGVSQSWIYITLF